ncbi:unnamed protein product [Ceutorhynchus assimilis]|uniref:Uncharacterized protein n=1 Tax=Ceutorhynchus assimilis TaxID=467358 RepID=A0A9P0DHL1_9CUCU|nr:unnamed protein product [Ceutorhynchus assimilis]
MSQILSRILNKCVFAKDQYQLHTNNNAVIILKDCLKRRGSRVLDRALSRDVIQITQNVVLVKRKNDTELSPSSPRNPDTEIMEKFLRFLKSRVLKITFKPDANLSLSESEGRGRHKNNQFGQMLTFGLVAAGLIVIPMGFQFLAVLGGKALLLAKLALLLTSIQGLKKIATSQVNYGLYSTGHGGPWHYDRQWHYDPEPYPFHSSSLGGPIVEHHPSLFSALQHQPVVEEHGSYQ